MPTFEIICLANSTKLSGRCIAGLKTDGSGWLRPVANTQDGTLYPEHYTLNDGTEPRLFDVIRIQCDQSKAECHQPENWVIKDKTWTFVGNPNLRQIQEILNPEVNRNSSQDLLGDCYSQISYAKLKEFPTQSSLALIYPRDLRWRVTSYEGKRKYRASFVLNRRDYDLPITDPIWKNKLTALEKGTYSCKAVIEELGLEDFDPDRFLLTISLGVPFPSEESDEQHCYKLIAGVINTTEVKKRLKLN